MHSGIEPISPDPTSATLEPAPQPSTARLASAASSASAAACTAASSSRSISTHWKTTSAPEYSRNSRASNGSSTPSPRAGAYSTGDQTLAQPKPPLARRDNLQPNRPIHVAVLVVAVNSHEGLELLRSRGSVRHILGTLGQEALHRPGQLFILQVHLRNRGGIAGESLTPATTPPWPALARVARGCTRRPPGYFARRDIRRWHGLSLVPMPGLAVPGLSPAVNQGR
eukprot:scaffold10239_cov122-Isochrysis_galbana.AAC.13